MSEQPHEALHEAQGHEAQHAREVAEVLAAFRAALSAVDGFRESLKRASGTPRLKRDAED